MNAELAMNSILLEDGSKIEYNLDVFPNKDIISVQVHGGKMHADDIFAVAITKICLEGKKQVVRVPSTDPSWDLRLDCGGEISFTDDKIVLDHHQRTKYAVDSNGVKMAACNLAWNVFKFKYFTHEWSDLEITSVMAKMDLFFKEIAAVDNGDEEAAKTATETSMNTVMGYFNVDPVAPAEIREQSFDNAVMVAELLLKQMITYTRRTARMLDRAMDEIEEAADDGTHVIRMSTVLPWLQVMKMHPELFVDKFLVTYPSIRDEQLQYYIQAIPIDVSNPFSQRVSAPEAWHGLRDKELQDITGVKEALFCHASGFLTTASTQAGADALINRILQNAGS